MVRKYRATCGISFPKDEAAFKRIAAGRATAADWTDAEKGELCTPTPGAAKLLLADGYIEEVKERG